MAYFSLLGGVGALNWGRVLSSPAHRLPFLGASSDALQYILIVLGLLLLGQSL
jgi:hypothetical protein